MIDKLVSRAAALVWLVGAAGCGAKQDAVEGPANAVAAPPTEIDQPAAAPAPSREQQLVGHWCLRTLTMSGSNRSELDGSAWDFAADGTYRYDAEILQRGTWTLSSGQLSLTNVGDHEVVELGAERMVLRRGGVDMTFHHDCGSEVDAARRVQALRKAASKGDAAMIKALLDQGLDVNAVDRLSSYKRTPLLAAVADAQIDAVKQLLARGANVYAVDADGKNAFEAALATSKAPELLPLLTAKLAKPASTKRPAFVALPESGMCAAGYVAVRGVCVHIDALLRQDLLAQIEAFKRGGASPSLAVAEAEPPPAQPEAQSAASGELGLDPAALMDHSGRWRNSASANAAASTGASTDSARQRDEASSWSDTSDDRPARAPSNRSRPVDEAALEKDLCAIAKEAIEKSRRGELDEQARMLGITPEEHQARLQQNYDGACR